MAEHDSIPGKCEKCGAPAQVQFTSLESGEVTARTALCRDCALRENLYFTGGSAGRFSLLILVLEREKEAGGDTSQILSVLKRLSGEDLPDEPAQWRAWANEHPDKVALSDDVFYETLTELGLMFFDSSHRGRMEFLVAMLESRLKSGEDVQPLLSRIRELSGKDLPADPEAWRKWIRTSSSEIRIDAQAFIDALEELGIMHSLGPYDGLTKKIDPEKPYSTT